MDYIAGVDRSQAHFLPPTVEEYVHAQAPVRFIDAFVDQLDLRALGFTKVQPQGTGRPPYHPGDLLKLYVYGYLQRIRSSRRLEAEAGRNLEVLWLLRMLRPDFKTIADFRKDNRKAFKEVFGQFNLLCRKLNLFGAELVAIDGSKFKALNSASRNFSQEQLRKFISHMDARIDAYLNELDAQDQEARSQPSPAAVDAQLPHKLEKLRARRSSYQEWLEQLEKSGQSEVSLTDADARKMKDAQQGGYFIGYNVQAAVDTRHDLIVAQEVVQSACDRGQLSAMAVAASEALAEPKLQVVADKGYHSAEQLAQCEAAGITAFVPAQGSRSGRSSKDGSAVFGKEKFRYEEAKDLYHCPAAAELKRRSHSGTQARPTVLYANAAACRQCALRSQCTKGTYRTIARSPHEAAVERAAARLEPTRAQMMAKRRQSVEHVFGTLRTWGHDTFLMKGLEKVRAELSLSALTYNLRRVLNLKSVPELIQALQMPVNG